MSRWYEITESVNMTTAERLAVTVFHEGRHIYDTDLNTWWYDNGTAIVADAGGGGDVTAAATLTEDAFVVGDTGPKAVKTATAAAARTALGLPNTTTDNALARYDGVAGDQQDSSVTLADAGSMSWPGAVTVIEQTSLETNEVQAKEALRTWKDHVQYGVAAPTVADVADRGIWWVDNAANPVEPKFRQDDGTDLNLKDGVDAKADLATHTTNQTYTHDQIDAAVDGLTNHVGDTTNPHDTSLANLVPGTHSDLENAAPDAGSILCTSIAGRNQITGLTDEPAPAVDDVVMVEDAVTGDKVKVQLQNLPGGSEVNDLTAAVTWANVPDANITESSVTQHEAALAIAASQLTGDVAIADGGTGASTAAGARTALAVPNISTGGTSPVGVVTPGAVGDLYVDTTADIAYQAVGTTSADWDATTGATGSGIITGTSNPPVDTTDFVAGEFYYVTTSQELWYNDAGTPERVGVVADGTSIEIDATNGLQLLGFDTATLDQIPKKNGSGDLEWVDANPLSGAGAPSTSIGNGYAVGKVYIDTTNNIAYTLVDPTVNFNVWDGGGSLPSYQDLTVTANISGVAASPVETTILALEQEFNHDNLADYFPNQHRAIDIATTRPVTADTPDRFHYDTVLNRLSFDNGSTWTDIALPVDGTTLEVASNQIQVKDAGIVATTKLSATGTKDATTFLRGDNTWAAAGGGTPSAWYTNGASGSTSTTGSYQTITSQASLPAGDYWVTWSSDIRTNNASTLGKLALSTDGSTAVANTVREWQAEFATDKKNLAMIAGKVTLGATGTIYVVHQHNAGTVTWGAWHACFQPLTAS